MPEFEAWLRTSLADSAQRFEAGPDFAELVNRRTTALRRRRLATIGAIGASGMAVAVVVVLALVGLGGGRDPGGRVTVDATGRGTDGPRATGRGTDGSPATAPPSGYADSGYRLWFNATVIPTDGADMAAALVNSGGLEATFGIGAWLDRWDGASWARHRWVSLCLDHWFCAGRLEDVEGARVVRAIGLVAGPGRPGPLERFRVDGLDPGWYRLTQEANEGVVAGGVFEVREGAPEPAPLDDPSAPSISVSPILVPSTGEEVRLTALVPPADVATAVEGLSETTSVERWEGGGWQVVATAGLRSGLGDPAGSTDRVAQIPPLDPGDYRIVRSAPGGATRAGRFWVVSPEDLAVVGASTDAGNDADIGPALTLGTPWDLPDEGVAVEVNGQIVFVGLDGTVLGHLAGTFWETPTLGALLSPSTNLLPVAPPRVGQHWLDPSTGSEQSQAVMGAPLWHGMRVLYFADEGSMLLLDGTDTTGTVASWPQDAPWWLSSDHRVVSYATCAQPGCPHRFYDSDMRDGGDLPGDCWVADNLGDFVQTRICDGGRSIVLVAPDRAGTGGPEGRSIPVPDGTDGEPQTATAVFGFGDVVRLDSASCEVSETAQVTPQEGGRALTPLFAHGPIGTPSNLPLGEAADERLLVHLNAAACDATASEPGVYLVDSDSGERSLVWAGTLLTGRARMWSPTGVELLGGSPLGP